MSKNRSLLAGNIKDKIFLKLFAFHKDHPLFKRSLWNDAEQANAL